MSKASLMLQEQLKELSKLKEAISRVKTLTRDYWGVLSDEDREEVQHVIDMLLDFLPPAQTK